MEGFDRAQFDEMLGLESVYRDEAARSGRPAAMCVYEGVAELVALELTLERLLVDDVVAADELRLEIADTSDDVLAVPLLTLALLDVDAPDDMLLIDDVVEEDIIEDAPIDVDEELDTTADVADELLELGTAVKPAALRMVLHSAMAFVLICSQLACHAPPAHMSFPLPPSSPFMLRPSMRSLPSSPFRYPAPVPPQSRSSSLAPRMVAESEAIIVSFP